MRGPSIQAGPEGTAVAVWIRHTGNGSTIVSRRYQPIAGWTEIPLWDQANDSSDPQIVIDGTGMATALWRQASGLFAARSFIGP